MPPSLWDAYCHAVVKLYVCCEIHIMCSMICKTMPYWSPRFEFIVWHGMKCKGFVCAHFVANSVVETLCVKIKFNSAGRPVSHNRITIHFCRSLQCLNCQGVRWSAAIESDYRKFPKSTQNWRSYATQVFPTADPRSFWQFKPWCNPASTGCTGQ